MPPVAHVEFKTDTSRTWAAVSATVQVPTARASGSRTARSNAVKRGAVSCRAWRVNAHCEVVIALMGENSK
jgi:hypothetical protein